MVLLVFYDAKMTLSISKTYLAALRYAAWASYHQSYLPQILY